MMLTAADIKSQFKHLFIKKKNIIHFLNFT